MRIYLEAVFHCDLGSAFYVVDFFQHQACGVRKIFVRFEQPGTM